MGHVIGAIVIVFCVCLSVTVAGEPVDSSRSAGTVTQERKQLTAEYCRRHYGVDTWKLSTPRMIVIHYSAFPTIAETRAFFSPDRLSALRSDIAKQGRLNVSAHFFVDGDGSVYRHIPEDMVARHAIGFNLDSIAIENVAANADGLTVMQLEADARLIRSLIEKYPSVEYLIGHHEYMDKTLPHFALYKENEKDYLPTVKVDPGERFMAALRKLLAEKYGINLKK